MSQLPAPPLSGPPYETAIGVHPVGYTGDCTQRVRAGDPGLQEPAEGPIESCVYERMRVRGSGQMPPLATHTIDEAGLAVVREWIASLSGG